MVCIKNKAGSFQGTCNPGHLQFFWGCTGSEDYACLCNIVELIIRMDQISTLYLTVSADTQRTSLYLNRNYLRCTRRKLSDLVSKNDDILKKSSNVLEITNSENASKIKSFKALSGMVSNTSMGSP